MGLSELGREKKKIQAKEMEVRGGMACWKNDKGSDV